MVARQNAGKDQREQVRRILGRQSWTGALFLAVALIVTLGTIGCAATRQSAGSAPTGNTSTGNASAPSSGDNTTPGPATAVLSTSNSNLGFGDVQVGTSTSQLITLTNTGNSNLRISAISVSGTGFTISGNSNATLTPNQSASVYVNFVPTAAGAAVGAVTIASDASNSMVAVSVTGMGTSQGSKHAVALSWTPSASNVVGYYVNRGTTSGGPYTRISAAADIAASYSDTSVTSGTYFYVVTSVDSSNIESAYSSEVQAIVP